MSSNCQAPGRHRTGGSSLSAKEKQVPQPEARRLNRQARGVETPRTNKRTQPQAKVPANAESLTFKGLTSARLETVLLYAIHYREDGLPGGKLPDPYWGGLAMIGRNEAKCRPSGFSSENVILGLLNAEPNHDRTAEGTSPDTSPCSSPI